MWSPALSAFVRVGLRLNLGFVFEATKKALISRRRTQTSADNLFFQPEKKSEA
jgi:hypothetical protein